MKIYDKILMLDIKIIIRNIIIVIFIINILLIIYNLYQLAIQPINNLVEKNMKIEYFMYSILYYFVCILPSLISIMFRPKKYIFILFILFINIYTLIFLINDVF